MWMHVMLMAWLGLTGFHVPVAPGERLWVEVTGTGQPVVLIPGLFGSAFGYRKVLPLLHETGYLTVVVEPLGTGRSARPEHADYSLSAQAHRIAAVLDTLGLQNVLVVAHSMGAAMAFRMAAGRPELVRGIVSLDGGTAENVATPSFRRALRLAPLLVLFGGAGRVRRELESALRSASGDKSWVTDDVIDGYVAPLVADLDAVIRVFRAMAASRDADSCLAQLESIRAPSLLLLGTGPKNAGLQLHEAATLGTRLRDLSVDTLAGVGHYVHEERPEAVAAAVARLYHDTTPGRRASASAPQNRTELTCVQS
jgi:pimeloyl-ACP methyl ester carboxylesterase